MSRGSLDRKACRRLLAKLKCEPQRCLRMRVLTLLKDNYNNIIPNVFLPGDVLRICLPRRDIRRHMKHHLEVVELSGYSVLSIAIWNVRRECGLQGD